MGSELQNLELKGAESAGCAFERVHGLCGVKS